MALSVHLVEHAEAVVRSEAQLPIRPERSRPFQRLPVPSLHVGFVEQLGLNPRPDQGMVLGFDGPQVLLYFLRVNQGERALLCHDHNSGWRPLARQARTRKRGRESILD